MVLETALAEIAKPLVTELVKKMVVPKLEQFSKWCKDNYNEYLIPKAEHFQEYLERSYTKYSIINTLAFHNSQRLLKEVYITQSLINTSSIYDIITKNNNVFKIDKLPVELIKKYKKILITDTAGMGKSTIMKYMFLDLIDRGLNDVGIPIFIDLNRLSKNHTILKEILKELNSLSEDFDKDMLLKFVQTGGFIFFMDGYDEISIVDRGEVTQDIQTFISKAGANNYYILTSRPEGHLPSFGDFQSFSIKPLTKKEAFELLRKYDITTNKVMSDKLIELLKSGKYDSIDEYLENPLLVSLLFIAYKYEQVIPLKKHEFYRQVYVALYKDHALTQGREPNEKRSGLDIDAFNKVLKCIGYICIKTIGVKFDEDTILKVIGKAKVFYANLSFTQSDFLSDLLISVPLFCKDGNEYKWAHKSLMEYFAARFIADETTEKKDDYLKNIYNDDSIFKYTNMLDLYYDIDYESFLKNIMMPFLKEYLIYHDNHYSKKSQINAEQIEVRISSLFCYYKVGIIRNKFVRSDTKSHADILTDDETDNLADVMARSILDSMTKKGTDSINLKLDSLDKMVDDKLYKLANYLTDVHEIWSLYMERSLGKNVEAFIDNQSDSPSKLFAAGLYQDFCILALYTSDRYYIIQKLIYDKQPNLFNQYKKESVKIDDEFFKENRVYKIDVMTGKNDPALFVLINNLLSSISFFDARINVDYMGNFYYLNYKAVKKEIENLERIIVRSDNKLFI